MGRRAVALVGACTILGLAASACIPDPGPTTPTGATLTAVAGVDAYAPYSSHLPTTPSPATDLAVNVYARSIAAVDADTVLIANYDEIVRYEDATGTVRRVAGAGSGPSGGPLYGGTPLPASFGGPAVDAFIAEPYEITPAPDGSIYFVPGGGPYIAAVRPDGTLERVAGTGGSAPTGDGGPAVDADLGSIRSLTIGPDGDLWFVDWSDTGADVRRIDVQTGTIDTAYDPGDDPWGPDDPRTTIDVGADGVLRDLGTDEEGRFGVRALTGDGATSETLDPACADQLGEATVLRGRTAGGALVALSGARTHVCTIDVVAGTSALRAVDAAAQGLLVSGDPHLLQPNGAIAVGPDGRRWFVARAVDAAYDWLSLRVWRWTPPA